MYRGSPSLYDIGALERESRFREIEKVAERLAPLPSQEGSSYDLGYVAKVTRASNEQKKIIRRLVGR